MHEENHFLHEEFTFLPYTTFTPVILPRIGAAVEEDLVTGTGVVGPGNRNNIQFASISVVTMHEE